MMMHPPTFLQPPPFPPATTPSGPMYRRFSNPLAKMSLRVDDVSKIDASKETWAIVVKVVRLWFTPSYSGSKLPSSLEMVLMDSKGCKIHASIRRTLVYRFKNQLFEGRVYQISFFGVCENGGDFRTTSHPYKVNFQMHTSVRLMVNTPITGKPFTFMPLSDVVFKDPDTSFLIDVIGILTGSSGEQEFEKHGKVQKRITLEIEQEGVRVEAAFFGKYVDEIVGQLASGDMTNAVVVVQFAKIKPFKGRPSIQNVYGATQILFNPAIDEAGPIRERFFETNGPAAKVICQLQDSAKLSPAEDFLKQNEGKTIEQIKDLAEKSVCVVFATVKFIPDDNSWYYPACKCNKKVYPAEDMYFCEACVRHVVTAIPKYKIRLRVMDAKDSTTFVLFDQEPNNLLNKPCSELVEKCHKDPSDSQVPSEIMSLIDKSFLFKIEVDNSSNTWFEPSYKVKRICSDPEVISQFKNANPHLESSPPYMLLTTPSSGSVGQGSSSSFAKDLNEDFNVAGGLSSNNSPVADISRGCREGSIVGAPVSELKMQFETQKKSNKGKAEILPKKDCLDVCKASNGAPGGSSTACDPYNLINEPAAIEASSKLVSGVNGSSPLENPELSATKHDDLAHDKEVKVPQKMKSVASKKNVSASSKKNVQDKALNVETEGIIKASLPYNVNSEKPLHVESNDSPPAKRPSPEANPISNNKKPLKMVKKEKI